MSGPVVTKEQHRDVKLAELLAIIERAATEPLGVEDRTLLVYAVQTLSRLQQEVKKTGATIAWLRKLTGGKKTEKTRVLLGQRKEVLEGADNADPTSTREVTPGPIAAAGAPRGDGGAPAEGASVAATGASESSGSPAAAAKDKPFKRPGHGRIPASAYTGAEHIRVSHPKLKKGDLCPCGCGGHLYPWAPHVSVLITGGPLLSGTVMEKDVLRSDACQQLYATGPVSGEGKPKFDASAKATIATAKYGYGMPFNRVLPVDVRDRTRIVVAAAAGPAGARKQHSSAQAAGHRGQPRRRANPQRASTAVQASQVTSTVTRAGRARVDLKFQGIQSEGASRTRLGCCKSAVRYSIGETCARNAVWMRLMKMSPTKAPLRVL